jgi:uncharacterized membrane protein YhaH (DUF805 family)
MTFGQAIKTVFSKYAVFRGRAGRAEFWWWYLFSALVSLVISIIMNISTAGVSAGDLNALLAADAPFFALSAIVGLALFLPTLGVTVRRLHDTNRSGGWWWIQLIPFVGSIILLVFMFLPSVEQGNRFNA